MNTLRNMKLPQLLSLSLLFSGVFCLPNGSSPRSELQGKILRPLEMDSGSSWYKHDIRYVHIKDTIKYITGFRSAFQWTIGETVNSRGLLNSIAFEIEDSVTPKLKYSGKLGFDSSDSTFGVHFYVHGADQSVAGESSTCSNYFSQMDMNDACLLTDFNLINNAIYFLDVELEGSSIKGYISEPQSNLDNMDDARLPRQLIGTYKFNYGVKNLVPTAYINMNHAENFSSYEMSSEITTVNYAPQVYNTNNAEYRPTTSLNINFDWNFWPQNTLLTLTGDKKIAVYLSRPTSSV